MPALLLGVVALVLLMAALGVFSRAQVASLKQFGAWVVAIGGLVLAVLLAFSGRGLIAVAALALLGPLAWGWLRPSLGGRRVGGPMSREEAYRVLGLAPGASEIEIHAAYRRLMRTAHPDRGGSNGQAARLNQARDVLLG